MMMMMMMMNEQTYQCFYLGTEKFMYLTGHNVFLLIARVPPEILARGVLALEAYNDALSVGTTSDKRVPVMLIGQNRSGKTSLKRSLKGEVFKPDESTTIGIEVDPAHFEVSTEVWKVGDNGQESNDGVAVSYEHHAAQFIVHSLTKETTSKGPLSKPVQTGTSLFSSKSFI